MRASFSHDDEGRLVDALRTSRNYTARLMASANPTSDRYMRCLAVTEAIDRLAGDLTGDETKLGGKPHGALVASVAYHVVVPFDCGEDGELVPGEAIEAPSVEAARRRAMFLGGKHAGAIAFTRIGDSATGEFGPSATIARVGEVDLDALTA